MHSACTPVPRVHGITHTFEAAMQMARTAAASVPPGSSLLSAGSCPLLMSFTTLNLPSVSAAVTRELKTSPLQAVAGQLSQPGVKE